MKTYSLLAVAGAMMTCGTATAIPTATDTGDSLRVDTITQNLGEAVVSAQRAIARIEGDALVTTVSGTYLEKMNTAEEMLEQIPGLGRTKDGIEVIGKGAPVYYINGRRVRDAAELSLLRPSEIRAVEVVRNPGARYDATTNAVVRIRTIKRQGEGISLDALGQLKQGRHTFGNTSLDLNYRRNALDIFAGINYYQGKGYGDTELFQEVNADTLWTQRIEQTSTSEKWHLGGKLGFNYDITPRHSIGVRYDLSNDFDDRGSGTLSADVWANGQYVDHLESRLDIKGKHDPLHQLNAYYVGQIGKGELSFDADYYTNRYEKQQITIEESENNDDRIVESVNPVSNQLFAAKGQYAFPLWQGRFCVGAQYTFTDRHDDNIVPTEQYGVVTSYSQLKEQNAAAFAEYARPFKWGQLSAGLRYEYVDFDYFSAGIYRPEQSRIYHRFFPNVSLSTRWKQTQWMLSYNTKTRRPTYGELSSNLTYGNRYLMQSGNPLLKPVITHDVTLMGVWKFLQGVVTFNYAKDQIIAWGEALKNNPSAIHIYQTNHSIPSMTAMITAAPKVKWWRPQITAAVQKQWLEMDVQGQKMRFNKPIFVGKWINTFTLPKDFTINTNLQYTSPGDTQNARLTRADVFYLNVSLQKTMLKGALSFTLSGEDLLHSIGKNAPRLFLPQSLFEQSGMSDTRCVRLSVRYRFNAVRSNYKGKGAATEHLNRL